MVVHGVAESTGIMAKPAGAELWRKTCTQGSQSLRREYIAAKEKEKMEADAKAKAKAEAEAEDVAKYCTADATM